MVSCRKAALSHLLPSVTIDELVQREPYTFVRLVWRNPATGSAYAGVGFSKCNPYYDTYNKEVGFAIAEGRALSDLIDDYLEAPEKS